MLTHSFEDLAQTFRVLLESHFKLVQLLNVDRAEAIGNLETALNAKLNAFHSLYDSMLQNNINTINWYETPELCIILAIRNARHHNKANKIRNIYNFHRHEAADPTTPQKYFYVDFPAPPEEEGGDCFDVPLSWFDIDLFLSLPRAESRLRPEARQLIREYLNADAFEQEAENNNIKKENIFINFVPIALNAGISLHDHIKDHVETDSTEATYFLQHFKTVQPAITREHENGVILFALPK